MVKAVEGVNADADDNDEHRAENPGQKIAIDQVRCFPPNFSGTQIS